MPEIRTAICVVCGAKYSLDSLKNLKKELTFGSVQGTRPTKQSVIQCRGCPSLLFIQFEGRWRPVLVDFEE